MLTPKTETQEPPNRARSEVSLGGVGFDYASLPGQPDFERTDEWALREIDLEVAKGEFVVIVGPSGCGKTTLLNLVAGLRPPTVGELLVADGEPHDRRDRMGWMPARHGLLPWRSALGNVTVPLEGGRSDLTRAKRKERAKALLDRLGLGGFEDFYPEQLSQGMRQRVSLARALISDPQLLLMDEPFGALDAQTKIRVQGEFLNAWEGSNRTVIFITHDIQEAVLLGDRILVMAPSPGRIVFDEMVGIERPRAGRLEDLFLSEGFRDMYHRLVDLVTAENVDWDAPPTRPGEIS